MKLQYYSWLIMVCVLSMYAQENSIPDDTPEFEEIDMVVNDMNIDHQHQHIEYPYHEVQKIMSYTACYSMLIVYGLVIDKEYGLPMIALGTSLLLLYKWFINFS